MNDLLKNLKDVFVNEYVGAALIAGIATFVGIYKINCQTSFKMLEKERLKQLKKIRDIILALRELTELSYLDKIKGNPRLFNQYQKCLCEEYNKFATMTACCDKQESVMRIELKKLILFANEYVSKTKCPKRANIQKEKIIAQKEIFFVLSDMYIWSLWKYIQRLYKNDRHLTLRYDSIFAKVYRKTYQISSNKQIFKKFRLKDLVTKSAAMNIILFWYKLRYSII